MTQQILWLFQAGELRGKRSRRFQFRCKYQILEPLPKRLPCHKSIGLNEQIPLSGNYTDNSEWALIYFTVSIYKILQKQLWLMWICVSESELKSQWRGELWQIRRLSPATFSTSCLLSQLITSPQCARGLWESHCRLLLRSNTECKSGHGTDKVKHEGGCRK